MDPRRTDTNRASKNDRSTLEEGGIMMEPFAKNKDIPSGLRDLFQLVHDVKHIRWKGFSGYRRSEESSVKQINTAAHDYDKQLSRRAQDLSYDCNEPKRENDDESKWIDVLEKSVFQRFNREEEEKARYHHCFVCRLHYPPESRPRLNRQSRRRPKRPKTDQNFHLCQNQNHINLSNFDVARHLSFITDVKNPDQPRKGSTKPDLTIGLCTYNVYSHPWCNEHKELAKDERVKLFDRRVLNDLRTDLNIPLLHHRRRNQAKDDCPQFPFALWEAKSATTSDTHQTSSIQTARDLRTILIWQQDFYEKSGVHGCPLVWYFNNIGPQWKVHGCYIRRSSIIPEGAVYVLTDLWSGNLAKNDEALQLLYIVDIIALWAEHDYKPFVGYCISRLEAKREGERFPFDGETLRAVQIEINRANFPWLFDRPTEQTNLPKHATNNLCLPASEIFSSRRRHSFQLAPQHTENTLCVEHNEDITSWRRRSFDNELSSGAEADASHQSRRPPSRSPNHMARPTIAKASSEIHRKPPTWSCQYIMPELHDHIWMLDADPGIGNLLVVRIDDEGTVLAPLVIFEGANWGHPQFKTVIRHENMRHSSSVLRTFTFSISGRHYMWRSIFEDDKYFCNPRVQFCAIVPLDLGNYRRELGNFSREPNYAIERYESFKPLERALAIRDLVSDIHHASNRWCICGAPYNEYSPSMVLCDNTKCKLDWYHNRCVSLDEDFETESTWICPECLRAPESMVLADEDASIDFEKDILTASDNRVHQTKTLEQVWEQHEWPSKDVILSLFEEISCSIDIDPSVASDAAKEEESRGDKGCWALSKSRPKRLMIVRPADNLDAEVDATEEDLNARISHLALGGSRRK